MQKPVKPLRKAAALFLCSNDKSPKNSHILMVKRLKNMSFQNLYVVPGGVCDPQDKTQANSNNFKEYGKITAIRQLFQETGILIYPKSFKMNQDLLFESDKEIINKIGQIWSGKLDQIIPIIRFMTPQFENTKRFDCFFYVASLGSHVSSINVKVFQRFRIQHYKEFINYFDNICINSLQSSAFLWEQPAKILEKVATDRKNFELPPPQKMILIGLINCPDFNDLNNLSNICAEPIMFRHKQKTFLPLLLLGDWQYPSQQMIDKQPQTQSKKDLVDYLSLNKSQINSQKQKFRRIEGPPFIFVVSLQQKSFLRYLPQKPIASKSKL